MRFHVCGPFPVARYDNGLIDASANARTIFWNKANEWWEDLQWASGCYVFCFRTSGKSKGNVTPWYVGKAEHQNFNGEVFSLHKLNHYNSVVAQAKGTPLIYLLPRVTMKDRLCKPTKAPSHSIQFLETLLIGMALRRNPDLKNARDTKLLKELTVYGVINSTVKGKPRPEVRSIKSALGLQQS